MRTTTTRLIAVSAALALAGAALAACGNSSDTGASDTGATEQEAGTDTDDADDTTDEGAADDAEGADFAGGSITIPIASGWDEDVVVTALWQHVLQEKGYTVDTPILDIGFIFEGIASGEYDFFFDTWLPNTHKQYWTDFGDKVVDVGVWYENAPLTIAVPDYMDIDSMADLASIADQVDSTITGIDPGAGLTDVTENSMMPAYGLDDWTLTTSSTSAMLAELQNAIDAQQPIVVTLWKPHWAYGAFPIKDLADPEGAMGEPDEIHTIANPDFADADPAVIEALANFTISDEQLASLEVAMLQDHEDDPDVGLAEWISANQDYVDSLLG